MIPRRWPLLLVVLTGCIEGLNSLTWYLAEGSVGDLAAPSGCSSQKNATIDFDGARSSYTALHAGRARIGCSGLSRIVLDVRKATRLEIEGPDSAESTSYATFRVLAFDASGTELTLGKRSPITWSYPAEFTRSTSCGDILPICPGETIAKLRGPAGTHTIAVSFGGVTARREVTWLPRAQ